MSLKDYKVYGVCANTQNLVHENLVYFQDLNGLAAHWIFSPTCVQFLVKRRNPLCNIVWLMIPNLAKSSLMGKIQGQSVSTYVLNSLFVSLPLLTFLTVCLYSHQQLAFSKSCLLAIITKISYQISWPMTPLSHISCQALHILRHEQGKCFMIMMMRPKKCWKSVTARGKNNTVQATFSITDKDFTTAINGSESENKMSNL